MPDEVNGTDLHFLAMMTPHHEQAVEMSDDVMDAEGTQAATDELAERIKTGQQDEIETMVGWAEDWGQQEVMQEHSTHIANGMLTPEQMSTLASLDGDAADTLFLQFMHYHHEAALAMTQDEIENGGYEPLRELAQQMVDVQTAEMEEMEASLEAKGQQTLSEQGI